VSENELVRGRLHPTHPHAMVRPQDPPTSESASVHAPDGEPLDGYRCTVNALAEFGLDDYIAPDRFSASELRRLRDLGAIIPVHSA
jgi:hypothetical protein